MAGPVEEAGKVANTTIESLKNQPVLIFLLVFILVVLGLFAWAGSNTREHYDKLYTALLQNQADILKACQK